MKEYQQLVKYVLDNGIRQENRTKTDTIAVFGYHYKIDLSAGFPLLTTKKVNFNAVIHELLWYLSGETHIRNLRQHTKIWDEWTSEVKNWEVGKMYGYQWVNWEKFTLDPDTKQYRKDYINQIENIITMIKSEPESRRMVVTAWNPSVLDKIALPSCHAFFMFSLMGNRINCHLTQRSADIALGVPFNIASYAALTELIALETGYQVGEFSHYINDAHIYVNHIDGLKRQLERRPYKLPKLKINFEHFWETRFEDFQLINYKHHPRLKFEIAV